MTLASEMTELAAELEAAQAARLTAVAAIAPTVRNSLSRTMAELTASIERDLKGIFSEAAFIRGAAEDFIDDLTDQREDRANALRAELAGYVAELEKMAARERGERLAYLNDLRAGVEAILDDARHYMNGLSKDRLRAGRVWRQHARTMAKQRLEAARPSPKPAPAPAPASAKSASTSKKKATSKTSSKTAAAES